MSEIRLVIFNLTAAIVSDVVEDTTLGKTVYPFSIGFSDNKSRAFKRLNHISTLLTQQISATISTYFYSRTLFGKVNVILIFVSS